METSTVLMAFKRGRRRHDIYRNPNHNAHLDFKAGFDICGTGRNSLAARSANDKVLGQSCCPRFKRTRFRLCRKLKSITPLTFRAAPTASSAHQIRERIVFLPATAKASCPEIFSATQRPGLLLQFLSNSSACPKARGELCSRH